VLLGGRKFQTLTVQTKMDLAETRIQKKIEGKVEIKAYRHTFYRKIK
jgi:hypothetical protein